MRPLEIKRMHQLEDTYWWFRARRDLVRLVLARHVPRQLRLVVDVGCGTGATLPILAAYGLVLAVDRSPEALTYCRSRCPGCHLVQAEGGRLPLASGTADLVTALDLLEHMDDDAAAVAEFARVLRAGGHLLTTVPAYMSLWSEHDVALAHRRRYRRQQLLSLLRGAGLQPVLCSYTITSLLAPIYLFRLGNRLLGRENLSEPRTALHVLPRPLNSLFTALVMAESRLLLRCPLPCGVSLVCLARKGG